MMNRDGVRNGYDLQQLRRVREVCKVPLIASGGAGTMEHFLEAFRDVTSTARWRHRCSTNKSSISAN